MAPQPSSAAVASKGMQPQQPVSRSAPQQGARNAQPPGVAQRHPTASNSSPPVPFGVKLRYIAVGVCGTIIVQTSLIGLQALRTGNAMALFFDQPLSEPALQSPLPPAADDNDSLIDLQEIDESSTLAPDSDSNSTYLQFGNHEIRLTPDEAKEYQKQKRTYGNVMDRFTDGEYGSR